eukprot:CAMPEP_0172318866 /NCGR_PEP_ID=MMETSP1058-20130122/36065_1 /TAXON_ID=83371 /ORGANISM="Detonula confervacea, Strain CCMP 353" /LENGTH=1029 /DNA_ID=CAMNT_0013033787 /DNA_START=371 /DNA_END=3460 /DNA_ORIENTATION=-
MKKVSSSSCSKLLTPPSILSSSRHGTDGRRWAHNLNQHQGVRKRISSRTGGANKTSVEFQDTSLKGLTEGLSSFTSFQNGKKKGKNRNNGQLKDKNNEGHISSIPPFTSASDRGVSSYPHSRSYDTWEPILDRLPPSKGSLFDKQLELPNSLSSESSSLFGPYDFSSSAIEGVLPVSELFYRSTQSTRSTAVNGIDGSLSNTSLCTQENEDDEELPFSAEQRDRLSTSGNKIQIRRSRADISSLVLGDVVTGMGIGMKGDRFPSEVVWRELNTMAEQEQEEQRQLDLRVQQRRMAMSENASRGSSVRGSKVNIPFNFGENSPSPNKSKLSEGVSKVTKSRNRKSKSASKAECATGRKMVRRGMEMLVGGEPINADPPQRSIELNYYRKHPKLWARAITTNSPDFGPLLHMHSAGKVAKESIGLFCEHFVDATLKWGICPDDLKFIVSEQEPTRRKPAVDTGHSADVPTRNHLNALSVSEEDIAALIQSITLFETTNNYTFTEKSFVSDGAGEAIIFNSRELEEPKGFGAQNKKRKKRKDILGGRSGITSDKSLGPVHMVSGQDFSEDDPSQQQEMRSDDRLTFTLGGELKFSLGVSRSEVEYGHGKAFRRVLRKGIGLSINADEMGFDVRIAKLVIVDVEGGSTDVVVQFQLYPRNEMGMSEAKRAAKEVNGALAGAMDDGKMAMTLAHVAREEKGWSAKIRNRIVEEFLFETEDDDEKEFDTDNADAEVYDPESDDLKCETYDGPFGMEGDVVHAKDDIWLGGGNGGVFFDYSKSNHLNSPYRGKLGPYLVDAAVERARQNQPRVIAIGDVHGCIDELKALLKKCDYHPGDAIVFLGDLVCKGPDSLSVVQMAREVGAIGVRGNHDFEVVRWHQAIKSGADPPVIGSEHYYVASALNTADLKWMYSLPWFISSSHLNALFVHAGFVSGIRLAKQNPRLMMNMRSILPDGTVTSKFFNNWPWARLWDGPQTVFFGHDADRGLQQYEHAIGLDTGCVYGGKLTACILPERRLVSVNAKREYFQYRRKHFD